MILRISVCRVDNYTNLLIFRCFLQNIDQKLNVQYAILRNHKQQDLESLLL